MSGRSYGRGPSFYAKRVRSVRVGGVVRSVQLENGFWEVLEEIAAREGMSVSRLITTLHNDLCEAHGSVRNLASALRCSCLVYLGHTEPARDERPAPGRLNRRVV